MMQLFHTIDWVLFALMAFCTLYLLLFAVAGMRYRNRSGAPARRQRRFAVVIPAYRGDGVIDPALDSLAAQDYPRERFRTVVVADKFRPGSVERMRRQRGAAVEVLDVDFAESSKARALAYAVEYLGADGADTIVILDVDNRVEADFLRRLNDAFEWGAEAVQAHRTALNRDTDVAVLDALSEEINNSIFRRGHVALGLSSALIGSGMAFDYAWFRERVGRLETAGEDKEIEAMLLREGRFIDYLDDVYVRDEKTRGQDNFARQRRRWLAAQLSMAFRSLGSLPAAILSGNVDWTDKLVQWMMPPRILLAGTIPLWGVLSLWLDAAASIKWWLLLLALLFALAAATPDAQFDERLRRALRRTPVLFLIMTANLFRLRGAARRFIHTQHEATDKP